jgi:hypothetical protein
VQTARVQPNRRLTTVVRLVDRLAGSNGAIANAREAVRADGIAAQQRQVVMAELVRGGESSRRTAP